MALLKIRHLFLGHQSVNVFGEEIHNVGLQILRSNLKTSFASMPLLSVCSKKEPFNPDADVTVVGVDRKVVSHLQSLGCVAGKNFIKDVFSVYF